MRPTREQTCMAIARVTALRSTCSRAQVGAVFASEGRPLVAGYNGAPKGMPHCDHACTCTPHQHMREDGQVEDRHDWECPYPRPCKISVHAEANAISWAARHGICLDGSELYTTYTPCWPCAQLLVNVGIARVFAGQLYRDTAGRDLLVSAGINVVDWESAMR